MITLDFLKKKKCYLDGQKIIVDERYHSINNLLEVTDREPFKYRITFSKRYRGLWLVNSYKTIRIEHSDPEDIEIKLREIEKDLPPFPEYLIKNRFIDNVGIEDVPIILTFIAVLILFFWYCELGESQKTFFVISSSLVIPIFIFLVIQKFKKGCSKFKW